MGEKKILTEEMIDEKLAKAETKEIRFIDPYKLAQWTLETACAMVDHAISPKTIERAIISGEIQAFKVGKFLTVEPTKFLLWYRRHTK